MLGEPDPHCRGTPVGSRVVRHRGKRHPPRRVSGGGRVGAARCGSDVAARPRALVEQPARGGIVGRCSPVTSAGSSSTTTCWPAISRMLAATGDAASTATSARSVHGGRSTPSRQYTSGPRSNATQSQSASAAGGVPSRGTRRAVCGRRASGGNAQILERPALLHHRHAVGDRDGTVAPLQRAPEALAELEAATSERLQRQPVTADEVNGPDYHSSSRASSIRASPARRP